MIPNNRTLIIASSLAAIPLITLLIAGAIQKKKRKSSRKAEFLGQTKSTKHVNTTNASDKKQLTAWQRSETKAVTNTANGLTNAGMTTNSTNTSNNPESLTAPILRSGTDSDIIISHQAEKGAQASLSDEAKKVGGSLKELIVEAVKEAKDSAKQTGKRMKEQTINVATTVDSKDIRSLEANADALVELFEEIMAEIRKEGYDDQIKLLDSYKELLRTHIKVVHARIRMASKLKPGS
jgi:predicted RNase H-related nuclease YkuK (DUF458 family)